MGFRFDSGKFSKIESGNGFVKYKGIIAKPGIIVYGDSSYERRELLPEEELFSEKTINSFKGIPVTEEHPANGVSPNNYNLFTKGALNDVYKENSYLMGEFSIFDPELNAKIASGEKIELSIGRTAKFDKSKGRYQGEEYDSIQREVKGNHLAIVSNARVKEARITQRLDSKEDILYQKENTMPAESQDLPLEIVYRADSDGKDHKIPKAVSDDIDVKKAKIKELEETGKEKEAQLKALKAELEASKNPVQPSDEIKALQSKINELTNSKALVEKEATAWKEKVEAIEKAKPAEIQEAAKERVELVSTASAIIGDSKGFDSLSNDQIKDLVINKVLPYDTGIRMDSITSDIRNAHYKAALRLSGEKAAMNPGKDPETRMDSKEDYRLNMHNYKEGNK